MYHWSSYCLVFGTGAASPSCLYQMTSVLSLVKVVWFNLLSSFLILLVACLLPVGNCRQSNIFTVAGVHNAIIIPQNQHGNDVCWRGCYCLPHICQRSIQVTLRSPYGHFSLRKAADLPRKAAGRVDGADNNTKISRHEWLIRHNFRCPVLPFYILRREHNVVSGNHYFIIHTWSNVVARTSVQVIIFQ